MINKIDKIELIDDWEKLKTYSEEWNKLWLENNYHTQLYSFEWLKLHIDLKENNNGHPLCFLFFSGSVLVTILPLYLRKRNNHVFRLNISLKTISFLPDGVSKPMHIIGNDLQLIKFKREIQKHLSKYNIHHFDLKGFSKEKALQYSDVFINRKSKYFIDRENEKSGSSLYDKFEINFSDGFEAYFGKRKRQFRTNVKSSYKKLKAKNFHFYRKCRGQHYGSLQLSNEEIISIIQEIDNNSWQKQIGKHFTKYGIENSTRILETISNQGVEDIAFLYFENQPVAYYLGTIFNQNGKCLFTAYNSDYREFSPGIVMLMEVIKHNCDINLLACIDMGGAGGKDYFYKSRLADIKTKTYDLRIYQYSLKSMLVFYFNKFKKQIKK